MLTANNGKRLMIECGVTWPKLQKALDFDLRGIEGCLLSHEHKDHSKAVKDVMTAGIDVYSSIGTFEALSITDNRRAMYVEHQTLVRLPSFQVLAFDSADPDSKEKHHDAAEPLLFVIRADSECLLFATDAKCISQQFKYSFSIIAIECSYNGPYLAKKVEAKTINEELAKRLLTSHMEESETKRYLQEFCDLSKCREIHLLHLSADNINKERIVKEIEKETFIKVITVKFITDFYKEGSAV